MDNKTLDSKEESKLDNNPDVIKIHLSRCVTYDTVIKFFVQLLFSFLLVCFSMYMILRSVQPDKETLWISILTSTVTTYLPSPTLTKNVTHS